MVRNEERFRLIEHYRWQIIPVPATTPREAPAGYVSVPRWMVILPGIGATVTFDQLDNAVDAALTMQKSWALRNN